MNSIIFVVHRDPRTIYHSLSGGSDLTEEFAVLTSSSNRMSRSRPENRPEILHEEATCTKAKHRRSRNRPCPFLRWFGTRYSSQCRSCDAPVVCDDCKLDLGNLSRLPVGFPWPFRQVWMRRYVEARSRRTSRQNASDRSGFETYACVVVGKNCSKMEGLLVVFCLVIVIENRRSLGFGTTRKESAWVF